MNTTLERYIQQRKDELYHFNPWHRKDNGQFTSGNGAGINKIHSVYTHKSDDYLVNHRNGAKKAAKIRMKAATVEGYNMRDIARDAEINAAEYKSRAAEVAEKIMSSPGDSNNDIYMKDLSDLETMAKRYQKVADIINRKMTFKPGSSNKPQIGDQDYDVWVREHNKRVAEILDKYYWG